MKQTVNNPFRVLTVTPPPKPPTQEQKDLLAVRRMNQSQSALGAAMLNEYRKARELWLNHRDLIDSEYTPEAIVAFMRRAIRIKSVIAAEAADLGVACPIDDDVPTLPMAILAEMLEG